MINAFSLAEEQLREIADSSKGTVQVHGKARLLKDHYCFEISIRFDGLDRIENGLPVRAREQFLVIVPPTFPFNFPHVRTPHTRFSGFRHVQWQRQLCLYRSSADWFPEDGMYGFIKQLDAWIRNAAINNLDPNDAPLHPPVEYHTVNRLIVPKVDTPLVAGSPWFGLAELRERSNRTEIVAWKELGHECPACFAPAVLLHEELPFEYPTTVASLLNEFKSHGLDCDTFIYLLAIYAQHSSHAGLPLTVILGTPMRRVIPNGRALQHLAVWQIRADDADKLRRLSFFAQAKDTSQLNAAVAEVVGWTASATVEWCVVHEMRPEVTRRRDSSSPMSWFRGKRVAIWGCGAIGTQVAESVVRAGVSSINLVDNKKVTPGLLVRQGFEDADIGKCKAVALSERLKRIDPDLQITVSTQDLVPCITGPDAIPKVDLVIDCTASSNIRTALEYALRKIDSRPAIASLAIDSQATSALATLSAPTHSGGPLDLVRRLKLEACRAAKLSKMLDAFWPQTAASESFQPEPGCSEPTFIGSNADLAELSARMLNAVARALGETLEYHTGAGWFFEGSGPIYSFKWSSDQTLQDHNQSYSIRVCLHAVREMRGWARRSARTVGATIETGGLVFGELNEAAGVLWVTEIDGPPSDSDAADDHFTCGIDGVEDAAQARSNRFRGSMECVGSWHTHPTSAPYPSSIDISAVKKLLAGPDSTRRTFLILILSGDLDDPILGAYSFKRNLSAENCVCIQRNAATRARLRPQPIKKQDIGLALSGGGSRAIAFHLGCLRALHDLDLLDRIQVISSVSAGSVISAMYAYSNDSFSAFDARVSQLLHRGLKRDILREMLKPVSMGRILLWQACQGMSFLTRMPRRLACAILRPDKELSCNLPSVRNFSRTEAFRNVIARSLFADTVMHNVRRHSLDTVINATELRTGSAFRFGSRQSGCWRFGTIVPEDALVADAVAASAAYPVFLPALEREYNFTMGGFAASPTRVLLSDGGAFENLGIGPMEPGRTSSISTNVFKPDYIICCDAGAGIFDEDCYPARWFARTRRSIDTIFRKAQDATRKRLHYLGDSRQISGFVHCYLGQQDRTLPWIPVGLPRREEVRHYPTDFAAMSTGDSERLALRGECLMRLLLAYYLPDI